MSTPSDLPTTSDLPGAAMPGAAIDAPGGGASDEAPVSAGRPIGTGPLGDPGTITGGPIDDPALADRANPRWNDATSPAPDAPGLGAPAGDIGTPKDQAAQELEGQLQVGTDNIREGRGGSTSNPAMAEGGDG